MIAYLLERDVEKCERFSAQQSRLRRLRKLICYPAPTYVI